jgi:hypothetical protein
MKALKLIPTIIKNFFLIIYDETKKLMRRSKIFKWAFWVVLILLLAGGGYKIWRYYRPNPNDPNLSLSQAAKIGQVTTHKLMVEIENPKCSPAMASGCYERGDIVLIKPGDWEFSDAEKTGFLILHMDLTDKQAEVLVRSLDKNTNQKGPNGEPQAQQLKMRRYAVDLQKIGIADNDQNGREVDTIYKWDVVKEK